MRKAYKSPFSSDFGFKSPNFNVDADGNITANSIILDIDSAGTFVDYTFSDDINENFTVENLLDINPPITLAKTRTYLIELNLENTGLYILEEDKLTEYTQNLKHDSGSTGSAAQGKLTGVLSITIPATFSQSTIYYSNINRTIFGEINIIDPIGLFSEVTITNTTQSIDTTTGALIVAGGISTEKNLTIGNNLLFTNNNPTTITSNNNLTISVLNTISLSNNTGLIGTIDNTGSSIPVKDTTVQTSNITNSSIDNTSIGTTTPATANFTTGTVLETGSNATSLPNKLYVDSTALSLAITFGI